MDAELLLTRGPDLVVLGVRLRGFTLQPEASSVTPPRMVAESDTSRIVLVFPPQHVLEQTFDQSLQPDARAAARLSGPSRVAYAVRAGTSVPLDALGILTACRTLALRPVEGARDAPPGPFDTRIEVPTGLVFSPMVEPTDGRSPGAVESPHAVREVFGADGAAGAWLTHLAALDALALHVTDPLAAQVEDPFRTALGRIDRMRIAAAAQTRPARAGRLQLSSLGGSLTALGDWDGLRWSHRATLGRDQEVVVEQRGVLYPFGLRAVLTGVVTRDPAGAVSAEALQTPRGGPPLPRLDPVPPGGALGLRSMTTLHLVDTVRTFSQAGATGRTFPFTAVEVTARRFSGLGPPEPGETFRRPTPLLDRLREQVDSARAESLQAEAVWRPAADGLTRTIDDLRRSGFPPIAVVDADGATLTPDGRTLTQIGEQLAELEDLDTANQRALDELASAQAALDRLRSMTPMSPEGSQDDPALAEASQAVAAAALEVAAHPFTADQARQLEALRAVVRTVRPQVDAAWQQCLQAMSSPRTAVDVAADVDVAEPAAAAQRWLELQPRLAELIAAVAAEEARPGTARFHIYAWPTTTEGRRLRFPLRLHRGDQIIDTTMPMIFVNDFVLPGDETTPEYASLTDPDLADRLDRAWQGSDFAGPSDPVPERDGATVASVEPAGDAAAVAASAGAVVLPGVLLDIVGATRPAPSDASVVQALHVLGPAGRAATGVAVSAQELFTPSVGRLATGRAPGRWAMRIDLPAVRSLLGAPPGTASDVAVMLSRDFVTRGADAAMLFDLAADLGVDFTQRADRSGGLTALQVQATAIARQFGPVQPAALTGSPTAVVGTAATLLGLPLKDLLATVPTPPTMVSTLAEGAQPVVELTWAGVTMGDLLFFRAHRGEDEQRPSRLVLTVRSTVDEVTTDCTLTDFSLLFPPEGKGLLRLDFAMLRYHQRTAHGTADAPDVAIEGFEAKLLGPLRLLEPLEAFASLIGSVPTVQAGPGGVRATYVLPVPDLACGAFSLSNIVFRSAVDIPFGGDPVSVGVAFASRENPFGVSVLTFGGTGYIDIRIDAHGPRIEACMDFGARMAVNFLVAKGEVHALGGVRYVQTGPAVELAGFIRIGGSVDVLGLVSASIELVVQLGYDAEAKQLAGRATMVLEIDLTLWSDSIEIDSGLWVLQGGTADRRALVESPDDEVFGLVDADLTDEELADWRTYRARFTREGVG